MKAFSRNGRLRRFISSVLSTAMVFSLVVMPAGVATAEPSTGNPATIVDGGTNLTVFGDVSQSLNGIAGEASIEVTGSLASQSRLQAGYSAISDVATLGALGVKRFDRFRIWYGAQGAAQLTTITGLTATSTVSQLRARIETQVPGITTSIEGSPARLWLTSKYWGRTSIAVTDTVGGVGRSIFGTGLPGQLDAFGSSLATTTCGRVFEGGSGYDHDYAGGGVPLSATLSFKISDDITFTVGAAALGTLDSLGSFEAGPNDIGLYTAVKLPDGYDLVLSTTAGAAIARGTATVTVTGGERGIVTPELRISQSPNPVEAGKTVTVTAEFSTANAGDTGIDGATFTMPAGFVPSADGITARVGSKDASVVVDVGTRTITVDKFFAKGTDSLEVTLGSTVPAAAGEYPVSGTFKNVGGSAIASVTAIGSIKVIGQGLAVSATPAIAGDESCGYAVANDFDTVTFAVRTILPEAGVTITAAPFSDKGTGSLNATSAVTDENGIATFTVRADLPCTDGDLVRYGRAFKRFVFTDEADGSIVANGFAHFYLSEVAAASASKRVAFADGTDKITYTFTMKNPLTGMTVPAGKRIYFASGGWDLEHSYLSAGCADTDANGQVSVDVYRDKPMTAYTQLAWVVAQEYGDFTRSNNSPQPVSPPVGIPGVQFMDYVATPEATVTAQQSSRGATATAELVIRDSAGTAVSFSRLAGAIEATSTRVLKTTPFSVTAKDSKISLAVEVRADDASTGFACVAGDVVQAAINGQVLVAGPFNSELPVVFGVDLPINIVNTAEAVGRGSIYLGKAKVTASNLKPGTPAIRAVQGDRSYTLNGTSIGVDLDGVARPQLFDMPVTMLKGTYDLVIDGITFPGALVVDDGIGIGVNKVVIQMGASRGVYPNYASPGGTLTLYGAATTVLNAGIPSAIVNVYSSATSDGANPVFIGSVLTGSGQFSFTVPADKSKYYFATTSANSLYMAGDSRQALGQALFVGVKSRASLKITSAPKTVYAGRNFTVKGSLPSHAESSTVTVLAYKLVSRRWVKKASFAVPIAGGTTAFTRIIKLPSRGSWRLVTSHADFDHLTSYSPYRSVTAR